MSVISRRAALAMAAAALMGGGGRGSAFAADAALPCGIMESPPWTLAGEDPPGIGVEVVAWMAAASGLPLVPRPAPAPRLRQEFESGVSKFVLYLRGPELDRAGHRLGIAGRVSLQVARRRGVTLSTLEDLRRLDLGLTRGGVAIEALRGVPPRRIEEVKDMERGITLLAGGRLDALLVSDVVFDWTVKRVNMRRAAFDTPLPLGQVEVELYGHRSLPDAILEAARAVMAEAPERWDAVMTRYRPEGEGAG